jgi:alpha-beta hydrolase superfamily lysophospholipase
VVECHDQGFPRKAKSDVNERIIDSPTIALHRESAQPLYLSAGEHQIFGWLHSAADDMQTSMGLVICKPFGFEAMSAHLSVRAFAEAAAEIGVPTLRFDYGGTGDSEDLAPSADQFAAWTQDIVAAVEELQRRTGVERVALLGIRLGALLAAAASSRLAGVCALIAVAPVINGRRYLKELRTFELAAAQTQAALGASAQKIQSEEAELAGPGHMEVSGFFLNERTMAALRQVDLLALQLPPLSHALLIDRADVPGGVAWREALSAAGIETQYAALPGFVEMIMRPPNLTEVPQAMVAAVRAWLMRISGPRSAVITNRQTSATVMRLPDAAGTIDEEPAVLRATPQLFAIATHPSGPELRRRGVILLNSGGDHHVGPRRFHVWLARRWARRGFVVMRMDLSGLGDSAAQPGRPRNELFPSAAIDDIRVAVNNMRERYAVRDVTLAGMCSGASHAVRAGMEGVPIDRVLAINPLVFFWEDGLDVNEVQPWEVVHKPSAYLGQLSSLRAWRRLLFGDVSIWRVAQIYLSRPVMSLQGHFRNLARALRIRLKNDLRGELRDLQARGVRVAFVFSRGDAGISLLRLQSGLSTKELESRYHLRTIEGADHQFTRSKARAALEQALSEELYAYGDVAANPTAANDGENSVGQALRQ